MPIQNEAPPQPGPLAKKFEVTWKILAAGGPSLVGLGAYVDKRSFFLLLPLLLLPAAWMSWTPLCDILQRISAKRKADTRAHQYFPEWLKLVEMFTHTAQNVNNAVPHELPQRTGLQYSPSLNNDLSQRLASEIVELGARFRGRPQDCPKALYAMFYWLMSAHYEAYIHRPLDLVKNNRGKVPEEVKDQMRHFKRGYDDLLKEYNRIVAALGKGGYYVAIHPDLW